MNVYEKCPTLENDEFLLRLIEKDDTEELLKVYSDEKAVPFFNSDNCDGDDFHYKTMERMTEAVDFWLESYKNGWFLRLSIVDKKSVEVIGTIEGCLRVSEDAFNGFGIIRLDLRSDYENEEDIFKIMSLIEPKSYDFFDCNEIITKAKDTAKERVKALKKLGFNKSDHKLIAKDQSQEYSDYWTKMREGESIRN